MTPLFSIIIPVFNRANRIIRSVESVLLQDYKNYEIIIVNDGSTDNLIEVLQPLLQKHSNIHLFSKENEERCIARNYGIEKASGEYVCFLDSDDTYYSNHLSVIKSSLEEYKYPPALALSYDLKKENGELLNTFTLKNKSNSKDFLVGNLISMNGIVIHKSVFEEDKFVHSSKFIYSEDFEFWLRIAAKHGIYFISEVTSTVWDYGDRSMNLSVSLEKIQDSYAVFFKQLDLHIFKCYFKEDYSYFLMKNRLQYALVLSLNNYKSESFRELKKAFFYNKKLIFQKTLYATLKRILF